MPATSPGDASIICVLKPRRSPQRKYIRNSISAQSCASVPPDPPWISTYALLGSISPENIRRNSSSCTCWLSLSTSSTINEIVSSSPSAIESWNSSSISSNADVNLSNVSTVSLSLTLSLPKDCARSGSSQILGFSKARFTWANCRALSS